MKYGIYEKDFELLDIAFLEVDREKSCVQRLERIANQFLDREQGLNKEILSLFSEELKRISDKLDETTDILGQVLDRSEEIKTA